MPNIQYFLGANSPRGFFSLYDQLIDSSTANSVYILKGGPGCGKSTLMRRVAAQAEQDGLPVERIICSGDPDSLDAVILPTLGAALVDGTAPHVVEPNYPGVVESYVNLGACYDMQALRPLRQDIMACMQGYRGCYQRAYRCLEAAMRLNDDVRTILLTPALEARMSKRVAGILRREIGRRKGAQSGKVVQRFLSGVTHKGEMTLFESATSQCQRVYELADSYGLTHTMLEQLMQGITVAGHDVVACLSPMAPDRLEHLIVPSLSLAFLTVRSDQTLPVRPYRRIRVEAMVDGELLRCNRPRLRFAKKVAAALVAEAVDSLALAKAMHDDLEAIYNPHVDFEQVNHIADEIATELLHSGD